MQKTRKILRGVSEKTALATKQPTNQPIITKNTDPKRNLNGKI